MAVRREDSASELKDIPITQSWIPATPAKPDSTRQQPICTNWQETIVVEPNWPEAETYTPTNLVTQANLSKSRILQGEYQQEAQCQTIPACYSSSNLINVSSGRNTWQTGLATDSPVYGDMLFNFDRWQEGESSTKEVGKWPNVSFADLLALAHAGCNKAAAGNKLERTNLVATSSMSAPSFNPQVESSHFIMNFSNPAMQNLDGLLGATYQAEYNTSNALTDGSSITPRPTLDLNSLPRILPDAAPCKIPSSQLEPITPAKTNNSEHRRECSGKDSSTEEAGIYEQENSPLVIDGLQLLENEKSDKGGTEETDLSKTPQQKPRRKKHRPKVIIEGTKSTPKSSAKRPSVPQDSNRVKRKYVRRKGVENNPTEERSNETGLDKNAAPDSVDTPVGKRKYVRRKGVSKPEEENLDMWTPEKREGNPPRRVTRSSCRRSLNFNSDGQMGDESSSCCPSSNCDEELKAEKDNMGISHGPAQSMNQVREDYLAKSSTNMDLLKDDQTVCTRGKCQIVFSDVTHDKEANTIQVPYRQRTPRSPIDSISSSACLTPEKQARGVKRQNMSTTVEAELSNRNEIGAFYNSMQAYLPVLSQVSDINNGTPNFHFPTIICKKKRSEKGHNMATSSSQFAVSASDNHAKLERQGLRDSCTKMFTLTNQNGRQVFEDLLALGPPERIKKRRSKGTTRLRDLASLLEICKELPASACRAATTSRIDQDIEILHQTPSCMEALVADTRPTLKTKKRSKRSMIINSTMQNLYNNRASTSMGAPLALTWKSISPIDTITEQLNRLDLNAESSQASDYQEHHALVPYQRWGAVVPFDNSFDQVRKRKPRPKVDLDDETTRVWKLLLENINSEGIDGTDEEKTKWWEEERRVFNGRANSFIARMHLVQGDRRFSPWKGSVVDSVVGVFLTQNVSDHLSSSAFMAMAARFPVKSKIHHVESDEEELGTSKEPDVCLLDPDFGLNKEVLNQSVCGGDAKMLDNPDDDSTKEVDSVKPSRSSSVELIQNDNLHGRDTEDTFSSQTPDFSSQNSADSPVVQTIEKSDSCLLSTSEEEPKAEIKPDRATSSTSFVKLLQMAGTVLHGVYEKECDRKICDDDRQVQSENSALNPQNGHYLEKPTFPAETIASCSKSTVSHVANSGAQATEFDSQTNCKFFTSPSEKGICATETSDLSSESATQSTSKRTTAVRVNEEPKVSSVNSLSTNNDQIDVDQKIIGNQANEVQAKSLLQEDNYKMQELSRNPTCQQNIVDVTSSNSNIDNSRNSDHKEVNSNKIIPDSDPHKLVNGSKAKGERTKKEKVPPIDWDQLRKQARASGKETVRTANTMDSVDWDAVRCTDVNEIARTIKERGMNNMLAERIKDFLNRIVRDHGSIDLEWLRDVPPDKAKEYLLSIRGLGLKSVECVRLLTLHHLAFPVDTNVGRIAVRLGWVPLQPLPESLQLHLLELYPVLESIQKYLWPRLCKLDQRTLYELHYQMITFGKVFCTKSKPNCNACPMRGECRHFASAFASARLALPAPAEKSIISATGNRTADQNPIRSMNALQLPSSQANQLDAKSGAGNSQPIIEEPPSPEPIIEVPASPEPGYAQVPECDIETAFGEDPEDIPTIQLNMEQFTHNLQNIMKQNTELQEGDMSKALVALTSEAASIPVPKLKNINRLRTEHQVYELPDSHPLLEGMDRREPDDPCPYLLAIWTPGETADSIEPPEQRCNSQGFGNLCNDETCSACNSIREANSQTVRGTLLIPCRTAMRGSFPLNGTYFQVNEVFSDHESSLSPIDVPRQWLWNLPRRTVYFGTSIPTIFKGLSTEGIQYCFWRGFVCVRGFDRVTRAPRPLIARLHFPASRLAKGKGKLDEN